MLAHSMWKNLCTITIFIIAATKGVFAVEDAIVGMSDRGLQQSNVNEDEKVLNVSNLVDGECTDKKLRFKVDPHKKSVSCKWVARQRTKQRCKLRGVAETCPFACNTCSVCDDSPLRLRFEYKERIMDRSCRWVANRDTDVRCGVDNMSGTCRATCGTCSNLPALTELYHSTNGDSWRRNDNWLQDSKYCNWYGIECFDGVVTDIILSNNNLIGTIPSEIGQLNQITSLVLNGNDLTGTIPTQIGQLKKLYRLFLTDNNMNGPIPEQMGNLIELQILLLSKNNFTGTVPFELCDNANIRVQVDNSVVVGCPILPLVWLTAVADKGSTDRCDGEDWVELANIGDTEVALNGYTLHDDKGAGDSKAFLFGADNTIAAGATITLCKDTEGSFEFGIGGDDTVTLRDANGEVVDTSGKLGDQGALNYVWTRGSPAGDWGYVVVGTLAPTSAPLRHSWGKKKNGQTL